MFENIKFNKKISGRIKDIRPADKKLITLKSVLNNDTLFKKYKKTIEQNAKMATKVTGYTYEEFICKQCDLALRTLQAYDNSNSIKKDVLQWLKNRDFARFRKGSKK